MNCNIVRNSQLRFAILTLCVWVLFSGHFCYGATGLTPESREVRAAVDQGVVYLASNGNKEKRTGGKALIALALYKSGAEEDHPLIQAAIRDIRAKMTNTITFPYPIYEIGICSMLLSELESDYSEELNYLSWALAYTQQDTGGWSYLRSGKPDNNRGGDMSMTQYAVMGGWSIHRSGGQIPEKMMVDVSKWLLLVQAADGGYAYTSTISSSGSISRDSVRPSTTAAGMASIYVLRDLFEMNERNKGSNPDFVPPKAFRRVEKEDDGVFGDGFAAAKKGIPKADFLRVQEKGNEWLARQFTPIDSKMMYFYYYLYAMERYFSFRELAENRRDPSPLWYNHIADFVIKEQKENGSWTGGLTAEVDTAYAILVLLRSTRKTLEKGPMRFDGGAMQGGRGLPGSTDQLEVRDGQIVSLTEMGSTESLLERLDELDDWDQETLDRLAKVTQEELEGLLSHNRSKVRQLVGTGDGELRLSTVRFLAKTGDVKFAPALIYALTDPDPNVVQAAQQSLLTLSRNPKGAKLPPVTAENYDEVRKEEIKSWKQWYQTLDPETYFEETR